ncbi:MAG: hypothetical protein O3A51_11890 [Verrucomicrobia bacterium]|nr:hypothetical protein [Verrucomicrobiota bacterium]
MKKALEWIVGSIVALLVIVLVVVMFQLGAVIKTGVETLGPNYIGSPVALESAFVRPISGNARLKGLVVSNHEGYKTPSAIELGELTVQIDMKSLTTDTIVIKSIMIDGPQFTYEKSLKKSNLAAILDHIEAQVPAGDETEAADKAEAPPSEPGKKVVIESLVVQNGKIRLSTALLMGKALNIPLPRIDMKDIGKEKDLSTAEAVALVFRKIIGSITTVAVEAIKGLGKGAMAVGGTAAKGAGAAVGMAGDAAGAAVGVAGNAAGAAVGVAGDAAGAAVDGAKALGGAAGDAAGVAGDAAGAAVGLAGDAAGAAMGGDKKLGGAVGGLFKFGSKSNAVDNAQVEAADPDDAAAVAD